MVGLLTPLAAGAIIGTLTVAFITNHRKAGFFVFRRPTEGWEYLMNLIAACFAIGCLGPGAGRSTTRSTSTCTAGRASSPPLVIGVGGAAALLIVFWRPPAPAPPS